MKLLGSLVKGRNHIVQVLLDLVSCVCRIGRGTAFKLLANDHLSVDVLDQAAGGSLVALRTLVNQLLKHPFRALVEIAVACTYKSFDS